MKAILITGFEPFGGEPVNPSWGVISSLGNAIIGRCRVIVHRLPYVFGESLTILSAAIDALSPSLVLVMGQAGGYADVTVERVAISVGNACIMGNQGQRPADVPIVIDGLTAWFSPLPIKAMAVAMCNAGIPASVSRTAGTFVCNHVMYGLLHKLRDVPAAKGSFIHILYLPQQTTQHPGAPSMATETMHHTLEIAIATTLQVEGDIAMMGDATH